MGDRRRKNEKWEFSVQRLVGQRPKDPRRTAACADTRAAAEPMHGGHHRFEAVTFPIV